MKIIDGKKLAELIRAEIKDKVARLDATPGLAIILVGQDQSSVTYVNLKERAAKEAGIHFEKHEFPETVSRDELLRIIKELNERQDIHGILVQLPLPGHLNEDEIIQAINPAKDVDGFHPDNIRTLIKGEARIIPGLPEGIIRLLVSTGEPLNEKRAVIISNSPVFSDPLSYLLHAHRVTAVWCRPDESNCREQISQADIIVVAVGRPGFITGDMVKPGVMLVDVGFVRRGKQVYGDVDWDSVRERVGWVTPVPGGVGPMTVAMLLNNVLRAYELQRH